MSGMALTTILWLRQGYTAGCTAAAVVHFYNWIMLRDFTCRFCAIRRSAGNILRIAVIFFQYVDTSSRNLCTASSDVLAFDNHFVQLHVHRRFDYTVKETIFERRPRTRGIVCHLLFGILLMFTPFFLLYVWGCLSPS